MKNDVSVSLEYCSFIYWFVGDDDFSHFYQTTSTYCTSIVLYLVFRFGA